MCDNIKNAFASAEMEGFTFTQEQRDFIISLIESVESKKITWDEAIKIVKARYRDGKNSNN